MSNIDRINEQLFAELTSEEGSAISGGNHNKYDFYIGNYSGKDVNYTIYYKKGKNWKKAFDNVAPYEEDSYYAREAYIKYDSKFGPGYEPKKAYLTPGYNIFDIDKWGYLTLTNENNGPIANITA
ncbi:hypothetical protein [Myxosarcina sp. GI1]|uniref:hypothetical protein n=1 Tax=Myxosarcina sp. GI1 TaxID=1541065 RepID=UPI000559FAF7|nr:hypothetical protein [Myxosarcina sp. GI1]